MAGTIGIDHETLLATDVDLVTKLDDLKRTLQPDPVTRVMRDSIPVNVYTSPEYYWERTFPTLYPYGMGGPSNTEFALKHLSDYHAHILKRGGGKTGRRFQNNSGSIFATYTYEMKRKVSGMAFAATRTEEIPSADNNMTNVGTVKSFLASLGEGVQGEKINQRENLEQYRLKQRELEQQRASAGGGRTANSSSSSSSSSSSAPVPAPAPAPAPPVLPNAANGLSINEDIEYRKLMQFTKKLISFGKQAPGTPMHINYERLNMMSMLHNPYVTELGRWRWFLTIAYADLYESRLFEIILDDVFEDGNNIHKRDWDKRTERVKHLSKQQRRAYLKNHPALVARLFNAKQFCIWKYVLAGIDMPFGEMKDFLRRIEVRIHIVL